jgi:putative addiction module component (TIGR02574 family)
MTQLAEKIYDNALDLPTEERLILIDKLINSVTPVDKSIERAWAVESERRLEAFKQGKTKAIPGDEVFRNIFSRLKS